MREKLRDQLREKLWEKLREKLRGEVEKLWGENTGRNFGDELLGETAGRNFWRNYGRNSGEIIAEIRGRVRKIVWERVVFFERVSETAWPRSHQKIYGGGSCASVSATKILVLDLWFLLPPARLTRVQQSFWKLENPRPRPIALSNIIKA